MELNIELINLKLDALKLMIPAEFQTILSRIDTFSNNVSSLLAPIAKRLDDLAAQIGKGGMTAEEESQVQATLSADADKIEAAAAALDALGKDPSNPTPSPLPEPEAPAPTSTPIQ